MKILVHSADIQDRDGAKLVLSGIKKRFPKLRKIWADGGYAGKLEEWCKTQERISLEIVRKTKEKGFQLLPKRWIVERTFGWLLPARRLSKDYELWDCCKMVIDLGYYLLLKKGVNRCYIKLNW